MRRGWRWAVLAAVGTLSVVLTSCTMLQPPSVDRPDPPATTSTAGPGTAWYLGSSEREAPGGIRAFLFADAEPTTPITVEFAIDTDAGTVTCPAGVTVPLRPVTGGRVASFGMACAACPVAVIMKVVAVSTQVIAKYWL